MKKFLIECMQRIYKTSVNVCTMVIQCFRPSRYSAEKARRPRIKRLTPLCCLMAGSVTILYKWKLTAPIGKMALHVLLWYDRAGETASHQSSQHTDRHVHVYVVVIYLLTWSQLVYTTGQNSSEIKFQHVFSWLDVSLRIFFYIISKKKGTISNAY